MSDEQLIDLWNKNPNNREIDWINSLQPFEYDEIVRLYNQNSKGEDHES